MEKIESKAQDSQGLTVEDMLDSARSSYFEFDLPTGILSEGELHRACVIREMTGEEEDILASRKMSFSKKMQMIVERCVLKLGSRAQGQEGWSEFLNGLLTSDRTFLIIQIRIASLGRDMAMQVQCPHCEAKSNQTVDLAEFKIGGLKYPTKWNWEGVLPKSKFDYQCRAFTVKDEEKVLKLAEKEEANSLLLLSRLNRLAGGPATIQAVKKLPLQDRNYLRNEIKEMEGEIDDEVEMECPSCGKEFKAEMEFGHQNFFFPSGN